MSKPYTFPVASCTALESLATVFGAQEIHMPTEVVPEELLTHEELASRHSSNLVNRDRML